MTNETTSILWTKGYRINSKGEWYKPASPTDCGLSSSVLERPLCNEPQRADAGKVQNPRGRSKVTVTSYRCRLLDPDNPCVKWFVDALRYLGVIPNDTAADIDLTVRQVQVHHRIDEHTEIVIEAAE